ncbi:MAG TPA: cytochrome c [Polyangiaceae bacterium]
MSRTLLVRIGSSAVLAAVACLAACKEQSHSSGGPTRPPEQIGAPAVAASSDPSLAGASEGQHYYRAQCAPCHGETGRGDGPDVIKKKLSQKSADYTNPEWQMTITDEEMRNIILYGGAGVGKSIDMPSFGDLQGKNHILNELIAIIRGFGKK